MNALKSHVEAFWTDAGDLGSVHVTTDDDLSLRFTRGEVAKSNVEHSDALLAMCLGVDGEPIDVLVCSGEEVYEVLMRAQSAINTALAGYAEQA